jgi:cbb3-type cytochrome oxidase subunit 3
MFEDLIRHPGFALFAIGGFVVAILWMIYRTRRDEEQTDIMYASMDLLYQLLER